MLSKTFTSPSISTSKVIQLFKNKSASSNTKNTFHPVFLLVANCEDDWTRMSFSFRRLGRVMNSLTAFARISVSVNVFFNQLPQSNANISHYEYTEEYVSIHHD